MMDLSFRMERNRKEAAKYSDLAKTASSPFLQGYYWRIAERYLSLEGEWTPQETSQSKAIYPPSSAAGHAPRP
jgi:hypothetical protein